MSNVEDKFYDYTYHEYIPLSSPRGKLKSADLLMRLFEVAGCDAAFYDFTHRIQEAIGSNRTVWGVKWVRRKLYWEYYFYNDRKVDSGVTVANLVRVMSPFLRCDAKPDDRLPFVMFSVDLAPQQFRQGTVAGFHLYTVAMDPRQTALSYFATATEAKLENFYAFYQAASEMREISRRVENSVYVDFNAVGLDEILLPDLVTCKRICVANKPREDAVYFGGIDITQFLFFLRRFDYPSDFISFVEGNCARLDHLQYDVGFDYRMSGDRIEVTKSGIYGTF